MKAAFRLLFFTVAAILTLAGWVRPPLSADISSLHLSLGLWHAQAVESLLHGVRRVPSDSAGVFVLGVIVCATAISLWRLRWFAIATGVLLAATIAANIAVALNHPSLIERLESERVQRQQIVEVLRYSPTADPLSTPSNGRFAIERHPVVVDPLWTDLITPYDYLLYGCWLVVWAALGVWFATGGMAPSRWKALAGWTVLGMLLGVALCSPRLRAETHWMAAQRAELRGDLREARQRVVTASGTFTEFRELQRTWELMGKLDFLESRSTPPAAFFRAAQLARVALEPQNDWNDVLLAEARFKRAVALVQPHASDPQWSGAGRVLAARILTELGIVLYVRDPRFTDAGFDYVEQNQRLVAARDVWQRAAALDRLRTDDPVFLTYTGPRLDRAAPDGAHIAITLGDRILRADVLNMLADAYFESGRMGEARRGYAESLDLMNLPQRKNFRAQKGLGGL